MKKIKEQYQVFDRNEAMDFKQEIVNFAQEKLGHDAFSNTTEENFSEEIAKAFWFELQDNFDKSERFQAHEEFKKLAREVYREQSFNSLTMMEQAIVRNILIEGEIFSDIVDSLSNSMEYFTKEEFIDYHKDLWKKPHLIRIWDAYWKLDSFSRNDFLTSDWQDFIKANK